MRRLVLLLIAAIAATPCAAEEMADGFVYLRDVDPTILQDMRYAGTDNFTGHAVNGYDAPECVLVREAAEGLKAVQEEVKTKGLSLKVYDCYRPARAVKAFVDWSKLPDDAKAKAIYYPALSKSALFPDCRPRLGRLGRHHGPYPRCAGRAAKCIVGRGQACTAAQGQWAPDASLDMGTAFDCFDVKANTVVPGLAPEQRQNRQMLVDVMRRHGFKNYDKEWWHYTLANEPFPSTIFDFPIEPRETSNDKK
jgi:D-alanyl-D-alanine dipeptidase